MPDAYATRKHHRRRWRRILQALTAACVLAALAIGAEDLHAAGLQSFFDRPPGVGATPSQDH
jgi:hypothetical protein